MENRERYFGEGDEEWNGVEVHISQVGNRHPTFTDFQQRIST